MVSAKNCGMLKEASTLDNQGSFLLFRLGQQGSLSCKSASSSNRGSGDKSSRETRGDPGEVRTPNCEAHHLAPQKSLEISKGGTEFATFGPFFVSEIPNRGTDFATFGPFSVSEIPKGGTEFTRSGPFSKMSSSQPSTLSTSSELNPRP